MSVPPEGAGRGREVPGLDPPGGEGPPTLEEVPGPQVEALLRKLGWALRLEPVDRPGAIPFYRIDRRFIEAALEVVRRAAHRRPEEYRRLLHPVDGGDRESVDRGK